MLVLFYFYKDKLGCVFEVLKEYGDECLFFLLKFYMELSSRIEEFFFFDRER